MRTVYKSDVSRMTIVIRGRGFMRTLPSTGIWFLEKRPMVTAMTTASKPAAARVKYDGIWMSVQSIGAPNRFQILKKEEVPR